MTISIPPSAQRKRRSYYAAERREIVLTYIRCPYGTKGQYAESVGVSADTIRDWMAALADGDLESGQAPRKTGKMTKDDVAEIRRLEKLLSEEKKKVAKLEAEKAQQARQYEADRKKWADFR